jgi:hypothetical protein
MLKRNIGVVIAGMLLSAQVGLAVASESAAPLGAEAIVARGEPPIQSTFQEQHADGAAAPRGDVFAASAWSNREKSAPSVLTTYQDLHAGSTAAVQGDSFPPEANKLWGRMLPAQAAYFDRKAERSTN